MNCIGNHWGDWDDDGEVLDAEYFRECSYCGVTIWLCAGCRDRVFLCARCFGAQRAEGKERARALGRRRDRQRIYARRRRLKASTRRFTRPVTQVRPLTHLVRGARIHTGPGPASKSESNHG